MAHACMSSIFTSGSLSLGFPITSMEIALESHTGNTSCHAPSVCLSPALIAYNYYTHNHAHTQPIPQLTKPTSVLASLCKHSQSHCPSHHETICTQTQHPEGFIWEEYIAEHWAAQVWGDERCVHWQVLQKILKWITGKSPYKRVRVCTCKFGRDRSLAHETSRWQT